MRTLPPDPGGVKDGEHARTSTAHGASLGIARRDAAHERQEADRPGALPPARRLFAVGLPEYGGVTADDIRDLAELPPATSPTLFGAVPCLANSRGWISAGWPERPRRPQAPARPVTRWRLVDAAAHPGRLRRQGVGG